ncbi:transposase family protein, partial [Iamia sp.]|uniref:transposase family protein n=1 Tax=Iamia sp. TaxID=2722710 RepID=UPI002CBF7CAA
MAILEVARGADGRVHVAVETTERAVGCGACGARASLKGRRRVPLAVLPTFGSPVSPVWHKRRWACREPECPVGSWSSTSSRAAKAPSSVPGWVANRS